MHELNTITGHFNNWAAKSLDLDVSNKPHFTFSVVRLDSERMLKLLFRHGRWGASDPAKEFTRLVFPGRGKLIDSGEYPSIPEWVSADADRRSICSYASSRFSGKAFS